MVYYLGPSNFTAKNPWLCIHFGHSGMDNLETQPMEYTDSQIATSVASVIQLEKDCFPKHIKHSPKSPKKWIWGIFVFQDFLGAPSDIGMTQDHSYILTIHFASVRQAWTQLKTRRHTHTHIYIRITI